VKLGGVLVVGVLVKGRDRREKGNDKGSGEKQKQRVPIRQSSRYLGQTMFVSSETRLEGTRALSMFRSAIKAAQLAAGRPCGVRLEKKPIGDRPGVYVRDRLVVLE
jgi:hypothetical protein